MQTLQLLNLSQIFIPFIWMFVLLYDFQKNKKVNIKFIKYGILVFASIFISIAYVSTSMQFEAWKNDPMSKYLLPPYDKNYFYNYSLYHFWLPYAMDLAISIAWTFYLILLCKYSNKRFLDKEEIYLGFLTSFVVGWPNFIYYVFIVFTLLIIKQLYNYYLLKKNVLVSMVLYMIAATIIVLTLSLYYNDRLGLDKLKLIS